MPRHPRTFAVIFVVLVLTLTGCSGDDRTFVAMPGAGQAPAAEAFVDGFFGGDYYRAAMLLDTAAHVAHIEGHGSVTDLYTFEGDFPDRGHVLCTITSTLDATGSGGGSGRCSDSLDPEPLVGHGMSGGSDHDDSEHKVDLFFAPLDAAWFRVQTTGGDTLTANVINRSSFVGWSGDDNEHIERAVILDREQNEIWAQEDFDQVGLITEANVGQAEEVAD